MIHKCRNCGMAVTFNPATQMMECASCGSLFLPSDFVEEPSPLENAGGFEQSQVDIPNQLNANLSSEIMMESSEKETMNCSIYTCSACGAELVINDAEAATFCAYCGQPAIVFQRIATQEKPKGIIPFKVGRDQAIRIIKSRFSQGQYIPQEIKDFNIEKVRGVYIPFWLFDVFYHDNMFWTGTVSSGKNNRTRKYYIREAQCNFQRLTQDASRNLLDESSKRLEPYYMNDMVPFDTGYLSGFYADRYDESEEILQSRIMGRAREIFNNKIKGTVRPSDASIMYSSPTINVLKTEYVLLPAWFYSFVYEGKKYTMLVNGQTGKLVGTVPFDKKKAIANFSFLFVIFSLACTMLSYVALPLFTKSDGDGFELLIGLLIFLFGAIKVKINKLKRTMEYTTASSTERYANDRQDV